MKSRTIVAVFAGLAGWAMAAAPAGALDPQSPADPCLGCHREATPAIARKWAASKHGKTGVKCYVCHIRDGASAAGGEEIDEHRGYRVTAKVVPARCEACHPQEFPTFRSRWSTVRFQVHGGRE